MYIAWTSHLQDPEEKELFRNSVRGSKHVLDRLRDIIDEQDNSLDRAEKSPKTYDTPNWDYKQAHSNGYRQCLQVLKTIVDLDHQKDSQ